MSILINMEMPNKTNGAVLIIYPDGKCAFEDGKTYQAVPVPPHGRLIDADSLVDWIYSDEPNAWKAPFRLCTADRSDVKFLLKQAPTIIPTSEEGE